MSSRLRDVLGLTVGLYLIAVGGLFALDSTGARHIGLGGLIEGAFGLALIALGIALSVTVSWGLLVLWPAVWGLFVLNNCRLALRMEHERENHTALT